MNNKQEAVTMIMSSKVAGHRLRLRLLLPILIWNLRIRYKTSCSAGVTVSGVKTPQHV